MPTTYEEQYAAAQGTSTTNSTSSTSYEAQYAAAQKEPNTSALEQSVDTTQTADVAASEQLVAPEEYPETELEQKLPYGALDVDKNGQAYYGSGLKGFLRQSWADLFDPQKWFGNLRLDEQEQDKLDTFRGETETKIQGFLDPLKNMGIDVEAWTGLGADEMAIAWTDRMGATVLGKEALDKRGKTALGYEFSNGLRMVKDATQRIAWGMLEMTGLDWLMRLDTATNVAAHEFANEYTGKKPPATYALDAGLVAMATGRVTQYYNMGIVALAMVKGDLKYSEWMSRVGQFRKGSEMAYTMAFEKGAVDRFEKEIETGKDPGLVARDLQSVYIELAGSIFGDPTTFLGASIPTLAKASKSGRVYQAARFGIGKFGVNLPWRIAGRIPEFGELIKPFAKVGKSAAEAKAASWFRSTPEIEKMIVKAADAPSAEDIIRIADENIAPAVARLRVGRDEELRVVSDAATQARKLAGEAAEKAKKFVGTPSEARYKKLADDAVRAADQAAGAEKTAIKTYKEGIQDILKQDYRMGAYVATSKAAIAGSDSTMIISSLVTADGPASAIDTMRTLRAWRGTNDAARATALKKLMLHPLSRMLLSPRGDMLGEMLNILDETVIDDILRTAGGDPLKLSKKLFGKLDEMLQKVYVSVADMEDAVKRVKGGSRLTDDIVLAARYDALPAYVKISHKSVLRAANKVQGVNVQAQSLVYMGWNPGYAVRNVTGQTVLMSMAMGVSEAMRISGAAVGAAVKDIAKQEGTETLIAYYAKNLEEMGIPIAEEMFKGISDVPADVKKLGKLDVRPLSQNIEKATGSGIIHKVATEHVMKYGGMRTDKLFKELRDANIPEEMAQQLVREMQRAGYNEKKGFDAFLKTLDGKVTKNWRNAPMPSLLDQWARETGVLEPLLKAQSEAQTPDEFLAIVGDLLNKQTKAAMDSAAGEAATFGNKVHQRAQEMVEGHVLLQNDISTGKLSDALRMEQNHFTGMVNAYQNADYQLSETMTALERKIGDLTAQGQITDPTIISDLRKRTDAINRWWDGPQGKYKRHNAVMDLTRQMYERSQNGENVVQLWNEMRVGNFYKLADVFPNVDPAMLDNKRFNDYLWKAYQDWTTEFWNTNQQRLLQWKLKAIDEALTRAGTDMPTFATENLGKNNPLTEFKNQVEYLAKWNETGSVPKEIKALYRAHPPTRTVGELIPGIETVSDGGKAVDVKKNIFDMLGISPKHALNAVNKDTGKKYVDISQVTVHELIDSAVSRMNPKIPAPYEGGNPSYARAFWESMPGMAKDMKAWANGVADQWGVTTKLPDLDPQMEQALRSNVVKFGEDMKVIRTQASILGVEMRNKMLFDYEKTYLDTAMAYLKPFGYWTNNAYASAFELMLANPKYANWYMSVKDFQAKQNAEQPEWYRQMIGVDVPILGHVFLNIEASLNPIYSLTGTDFNDPKRRIDYTTSVIDDMGKIGGANNTLINWAVASYAMLKGEKEAARRWAGRMLPQSAPLKAVLNTGLVEDKSLLDLLGIKNIPEDNFFSFLRYGEIDPLVAAQGGLDPYEEGRVNNQLVQWVEEGVNEQDKLNRQAQAIDASTQRSGPLWDAAVDGAIDQRGLGKVLGFLGGPGMQTRTEADMKIEAFYSQYYQLVALKDTMDADQYRAAWDSMRKGHEFMDILLIGKMSGQDRDEALAYNVLGRLPPGSLSDIAAEVGIDQQLISRFYENKGFDGWSQLDVDNFRLGVLNLSAMLAIPDTATRQEWTQAKSTYSNLQEEMQARFGKDIDVEINKYYKGTKEMTPRIQAALDFQNAMIVNNPVLSPYYGGLAQIEKYYFNQVYDQLGREYPDIDKYIELWGLLNMQGNSKEATAVYKRYHLDEYFNRLSAYKELANRQVVDMAAELPSVELNVRADFSPNSVIQQNLADASVQPQFPTWDALTEDMPDILQSNVRAYFEDGTKLNYASRKKLEYLAGQLGYSNLDEYLRYLGISLQR